MRKPPQLWHGVARKGLSQRRQSPAASASVEWSHSSKGDAAFVPGGAMSLRRGLNRLTQLDYDICGLPSGWRWIQDRPPRSRQFRVRVTAT